MSKFLFFFEYVSLMER